MKRVLLSGLLSLGVALPAAAALKAGDPAPDFSAQASLAGKEFTFSMKEALKKGPVVVYFYPSAYTRGCNLQAHTFAVNYDKFAAAGATVVGVSLDNIERLNQFSADPNYCAGKFPVASDSELKVAKMYDLSTNAGRPGMKDVRGVEIGHDFIERETFVVGTDGKIIATFSSKDDKLSPAQHVEKSLDIVEHLKNGTSGF